ncbi:hypothetical protein [Lutimaribacter saemankumensis]|uniref:Uncharacterized protein n=1 Tax=Lutimaribacter saemankumensis TaxID=490829 RepID=A0A1G8M825_9RHOB|nr:hypothetical protein [Lutimaribacter saemankumensis]SDI64084.1 hypothetical protein SAMN05421850_10484 [Lutimaribacter saemankumensis]
MTDLEKEFLLAEYATLRDEIADRQAKTFQIITAGLFGIPSIVALGKVVEDEFNVGEALFLMAPAIVIVSCFLYVSQHTGMMRAGSYIRHHIEPRFLAAGKGWENWLEDKDSKERLRSRRVDAYLNICFFVVVCLYFIGAIMAFWEFSGPLFGIPSLNSFVAIIYVILGIVTIGAAVNEAMTGHDGKPAESSGSES